MAHFYFFKDLSIVGIPGQKLEASTDPTVSVPPVSFTVPKSVSYARNLLDLLIIGGLAIFAATSMTYEMSDFDGVADLNLLARESAQLNGQSPGDNADLNDYSFLTTFDAFAGSQAIVTAPAGTAAPETALKIDIFGLRAESAGAGSAIVKVQGENQKHLLVGDRITNGVYLAGVYADRIEISRGGVREAVYLIKNPALRSGTPLRSQSSTAPSPSMQDNSRADREAEFKAAFDALGLQLYRRDGRGVGFEITAAADPTLLGLLGLDVGDIIKSVNNERVSSRERLQELPGELEGQKNLTIALERLGEDMKLQATLP